MTDESWGVRDYLRLGTSAFCYSHIWKFFYHMDLVIIRKHYFHWFSSIWYAAGMVRMWWLKIIVKNFFLNNIKPTVISIRPSMPYGT